MELKPKSAPQRLLWAQFDALQMGSGWDESDVTKPQILLEDVFGDSHPGSTHLAGLMEQAKYGVFERGGYPAQYHTTDICDGCAQGHDGMNYILASREAIADMIEVHGSVYPWDGMLLSASCDKSIPAQLKAAARLDLPTIFIPGGSMRPGPNMTTSLVAGDISLRQKRKNAVTAQEIRDYKLTGCPSCGACTFLGTASTMQCMAEALGLTLPGAALMPATMRDIFAGARQAGRQILELIKRNIRVSDILTREAFENAIVVHSAIGGSTNATIHLPSIARELGLDLEPELFDEINHKVPHLGNINPSGQHLTESFWFAGGVPMVELYLKDMLHLDVMTVTGKTLGENLEDLERDNFFARNLGYLHNYGLERDDVIFPVAKATEKGSVAIPARQPRAGRGGHQVFGLQPGNARAQRPRARVRPRGGRLPGRCGRPGGTRGHPCDPLRRPARLRHARNAHDDRGHRLRRKAQRHRLARHRRAVLGRNARRGHRPCLAGSRQRRPAGFHRDRRHHRLQRQKPHAGRCRHRRGGMPARRGRPRAGRTRPKRRCAAPAAQGLVQALHQPRPVRHAGRGV